MNRDLHFSSNSDEWETPSELFAKLDDEFGFSFDLCATDINAKTDSFTSDIESFSIIAKDEPFKSYFMNPPYSKGKQIKCIDAAWKISQLPGRTVVCLIPARTDTKLWHKYIWDNENHKVRDGVELRLLKGRLKFEQNGISKDPAPFPSAIVIFRPC